MTHFEGFIDSNIDFYTEILKLAFAVYKTNNEMHSL